LGKKRQNPAVSQKSASGVTADQEDVFWQGKASSFSKLLREKQSEYFESFSGICIYRDPKKKHKAEGQSKRTILLEQNVAGLRLKGL